MSCGPRLGRVASAHLRPAAIPHARPPRTGSGAVAATGKTTSPRRRRDHSGGHRAQRLAPATPDTWVLSRRFSQTQNHTGRAGERRGGVAVPQPTPSRSDPWRDTEGVGRQRRSGVPPRASTRAATFRGGKGPRRRLPVRSRAGRRRSSGRFRAPPACQRSSARRASRCRVEPTPRSRSRQTGRRRCP
jgi:hypothetical protein